MHQPCFITDEEGEGLSDGEIVHALGALFKLNRLDEPILAVGLAHGHPRPQLAGVDPAAQQDAEGVLRRGLDPLAAQGELNDDRVEVREGVGDGVDARRPQALVVREDQLSQKFEDL